jgi:hypothetical protein
MQIEYTIQFLTNGVKITQKIDEGGASDTAESQAMAVQAARVVTLGASKKATSEVSSETGGGATSDRSGTGSGATSDRSGTGSGATSDRSGTGSGGSFSKPVVILGPVVIGGKPASAARSDVPTE